MKAFLKNWYWKIAYIVFSLLFIGFLAEVFDVVPCLKQALNYVKDAPTDVIAIANIVLVCITCITVYFVIRTDLRSVRLFVGQMRPLIDATPLGIVQTSGSHAMTGFSIINYSGFTAYEVGIDVKYGNNNWIGEWEKADDDKKTKGSAEGVVVGHVYPSRPTALISVLKPGQSKELKYSKHGGFVQSQGSLNLENKVCNKDSLGLRVLARITWKNHHGHIFDAVHKYRLICTKVDGGRSFTFIPEGIISQKD